MSRSASLVRIAAAAAGFAVLALSGCAGSPGTEPAPVPTASSEPTPSSGSGDPLEHVTTIVARPQALELRDEADTVIVSFDYYADDAAMVVDALTEVFGEPAAVEEVHGSQETVPATRHGWGALTLVEQRYRDAEQRDSLVPTRAPAFVVEFDGSSSNGIELASADGRTVGEPWSAVEAQATFTTASECAHAYTESKEIEVVWYDGSPRTDRIIVDLVPSEDSTVLGGVRAPVVETGCV